MSFPCLSVWRLFQPKNAVQSSRQARQHRFSRHALNWSLRTSPSRTGKDGAPQRIDFFTGEDSPVTVGFLRYVSGWFCSDPACEYQELAQPTG